MRKTCYPQIPISFNNILHAGTFVFQHYVTIHRPLGDHVQLTASLLVVMLLSIQAIHPIHPIHSLLLKEREAFLATQVGRSVNEGLTNITVFHERTPTVPSLHRAYFVLGELWLLLFNCSWLTIQPVL